MHKILSKTLPNFHQLNSYTHELTPQKHKNRHTDTDTEFKKSI